MPPESGGAVERRAVPCKRGHPLARSYRNARGHWRCRDCQLASVKRWQERNPQTVRAERARQSERQLAARTAPPNRDRAADRLAKGSARDTATGCLLWTKGTDREGYGQLQLDNRTWSAHRLSWTVHRGPIPAGLVVDHLCRVKACSEPQHLRLTTREGNAANVGKPEADPLATLWDRYAEVPGGLLIMHGMAKLSD